jgi:hypothetical protein
MTRHRPHLTIPFLALLLAACGAHARFEIIRPALFDASPYGNTYTVAPVGGVDARAAYRVQSSLEQRIVHSLNPSIRLLVAGGGVIVGADVVDHSYREDLTNRADTCYRSESYRDAYGRVQTRSVPYTCYHYTRTGYAHSAIRFTLTIASTGQVIFDRTYEGSDSVSTSAINAAPPGIDSDRMLFALVDGAVDDFARVILPWRDTVEVAFTDCGGGEGCDEAFRAIQQNDLRTAEAIYTRILGPYDDATAVPSGEDAEIVAETLFNRGVVRAYTGSFELGIADIQRALSIQPNHDDWRAELAQIEALAAEQDQLRQQIEGSH